MRPVTSLKPRNCRTAAGKPSKSLRFLNYSALSMALAMALGQLSAHAQAPSQQTSAIKSFRIQPGPMLAALEQFARTSGVNVAYDTAAMQRIQTPGVSGNYVAGEALQMLLSGSGIVAIPQPDGGYALRPAQSAQATDSSLPLPAITVSSNADAAPPTFAGGQVAKTSSLGLLGNKSFLDIPFSAVSFTSKLIQDQQATSVADILTGLDPSVRAAIGSSNRYDAYTIRGFRVPNSDVALNGLYGLLPNYRIGSDSVERIDLLRGPSALLNGIAPGGSVGGAVNIMTKRAGDEPLTEGTLEYSSKSRKGIHADLGRRFGDDNQFGVRINAAVRDGDTPYDNQSMRTNSLSIGADYKSRHLRIEGDLIYQDDWMRAPERGYNVAAGVRVPSVPNANINVSQVYDFSDTQSTTGFGKVEYDLTDDVTAYATLGGNKFNFNKRESPGGTITTNTGTVSTVSTAQFGSYETYTGEVGLRAKLTTGAVRHEVSVSANRMHQAYRLGQTAYATYLTNIYNPVTLPQQTTPLAATTYGEGPASEVTLQSYALADTLSFADGLVQLTAGLRRQNVESQTYAPTTAAITRRYDSSATTPMVGVVLRPTQTLSLYASYIEALTQGPQPPANAINTADVFAPFKTKQVEMGAKLDYGTFGASASIFQISSPVGITNPTTRIYSLDGEQRHRGLEVSGFGEVASGVRLLGGITFLNAKLTQTAGGINNGKRAVGVPDMQANLAGEWDVPQIAGLTSTARAVYTGQTYLDAANTQSVPSWTRFDLGARYVFKASKNPVTIRANVTNLFNRHHWEANPSGYLLVGSARALTLSASFNF
ncbi:TonB-dependent receptor [Herbaspirillum sp. alder98]|uniref:TonB-dependent receptor n=1 Tax=Herbaspirillum sp. alder98 TaxID=2913096 RepID=UPI001CD91137|nr:TonB-dependent receptor [Herbaspirillum sp. alder98]MCA1323575.1 TonB-dependent receptor [Herbaspirillum sp. alder98]